MVGRMALDHVILVQVQAPEPCAGNAVIMVRIHVPSHDLVIGYDPNPSGYLTLVVRLRGITNYNNPYGLLLRYLYQSRLPIFSL